MQVKKFEAPTIQEALETIKRELGPEAIILSTRQNKKGFGLMSKGSVEVTAAVSDRSLQKKSQLEKKLPEETKDAIQRMPSGRQADAYDKYDNKKAERSSVRNAAASATAKRLTQTRYAEIDSASVSARTSVDGGVEPEVRDSMSISAAARSAASVPGAPARAAAPSRAPAAPAPNAALTTPGMTVEDELTYLKRMVEELRDSQQRQDRQERDGAGGSGAGAQAFLSPGTLHTPALQEAFELMVINGVDKRYALRLIKEVGFELGENSSKVQDQVLDQLATRMMESTKVASPLAGLEPGRKENGPAVFALVGPTGVGKTTTVAKIASLALLRRGLKVGLVNLDSYKVAAFDQLATYAKILNVPFRSVSSVDDLKVALQDFQALDLVLVDTTGRSQRDPASLKEMQSLLQSVEGIRSRLVLSVTTRDAELYDMASRFSLFKPEGLIVSKLDEATCYGGLFNLTQKLPLPLMYFTTGQRVPEDIEEATRERVAALVLEL